MNLFLQNNLYNILLNSLINSNFDCQSHMFSHLDVIDKLTWSVEDGVKDGDLLLFTVW